MSGVLRKLYHAVRPALFWSYRRGSWQYDVIVVLILGFIFLTPRSFFSDQPRLPSVQQIEALTDTEGTMIYLVDPSAVGSATGIERTTKLQDLLRQRTGEKLNVIEARPTANDQGDLTGYLVYARP
jgi:hypothetical protein